jgi:2-dehydro-3-deoxygluconokinase
MTPLPLKPADQCRWDAIGLGEVMLRLDPGENRIHTCRSLAVWEGGGEYNAIRGLRRCFGLRTAIATAIVDNPIGRLVEDLMLQGGVDTSLIRWVPFDGVGRRVRNGLYFLERGFGPRAAFGCSDRGHTAVSQLRPGDFDWAIFGPSHGACWFHTGGIFSALSDYAPAVAAEAIAAAREQGTVVSFDLNYRESLWKDHGGNARAQQVYPDLVRAVDVLFGSEEDFADRLRVDLAGIRSAPGPLPLAAHEQILRRVAAAYPDLRVIASTLRTAESASRNEWGAVMLCEGAFVHVPTRPIEILDRVGGGDSFAAGVIYGFLAGRSPEWTLQCGVAHGALAMTTPGDSSMATLAEVERLMAGPSARAIR